MNILFLSRRFYPEIGGVEKHVQRISEELIKLGHTITIVTEVDQSKSKNFYQTLNKTAKNVTNSKKPVKSSYFEHYMQKKLRVIYFDPGKEGWFKKFRIWRWFYLNPKFIKDADVVHCHDVFFWYLPFRLIYSSKKVFTTFHGYESYPIKKKNILIRKISEILSNGNICVGEFMKKWYFANPDYVIYGGVDIPKKTRYINKPIALFFGRLDSHTGIETYIKAARLIKKNIPRFKLDVIGEGYLKKKINYPVIKPDRHIEAKIGNFRYVFVSRYLSILEALASKRMVFAVYDNPLKRDYLEMSPFKKYINIVNNKQDLASKVQFYYSNTKNEQEIINKSYKWVSFQSWSRIASTYDKLWKKK